MSMPLTSQQLAQLRAKLEARRPQLLAETEAGLEESETRAFDPTPERGIGESGEESVAAEQESLNLSMIGRDVEELRDIDGALARMADGTYGVCIDCGEDIPVARLMATPTAKRCLRDQEIYERTHATGGTPSL
jgi:RNA polymerase-binding protein DksA